MPDNRVRIGAGKWRSRVIHFPGDSSIRPTPDRVRETLFNWLGQTLYGKNCLDLFSGSGALGFEAASRGAERVVMVESNFKVFRALSENAGKLLGAEGGDQLDLVHRDALEFVGRDRRRFDVIFLDPPFGQGYLPKLLPLLPTHLNPGGRVYIEAGEVPELGGGWQVERSGRAGKVNYQLLHWNDSE